MWGTGNYKIYPADSPVEVGPKRIGVGIVGVLFTSSQRLQWATVPVPATIRGEIKGKHIRHTFSGIEPESVVKPRDSHFQFGCIGEEGIIGWHIQGRPIQVLLTGGRQQKQRY